MVIRDLLVVALLEEASIRRVGDFERHLDVVTATMGILSSLSSFVSLLLINGGC